MPVGCGGLTRQEALFGPGGGASDTTVYVPWTSSLLISTPTGCPTAD